MEDVKGISIEGFAGKLNELMTVISRAFFRKQPGEFYKIKLTMPQFVILNFLSHHDGATMTDIAKFLNVTTAAVTGLVDRLARDGYIKRAHDPKDRRVVKVVTTEKGKKLMASANNKRKEMTVELFGKISQKEREEYLKILMHLRDHLK